MSLTYDDLQAIRSIVEEVVRPMIDPLEGRLVALEDDVKEIYGMISDLQRGVRGIRSELKMKQI